VEREGGKILRVQREELGEEHVESWGKGAVSFKLEGKTSSLGKMENWLAHVEKDELREIGMSAPKNSACWRRFLLGLLGLGIIKDGVWVSRGERTRGAFSFKAT
jgi:hypothetical protein